MNTDKIYAESIAKEYAPKVAQRLAQAGCNIVRFHQLDAEWDTPNLFLTPHVAGGMRLEVTRKTCVQMSLDNLKRYLAGDSLHNLVK